MHPQLFPTRTKDKWFGLNSMEIATRYVRKLYGSGANWINKEFPLWYQSVLTGNLKSALATVFLITGRLTKNLWHGSGSAINSRCDLQQVLQRARTNEEARVKRGKCLSEAGGVMEKDLFLSLEKLINNLRVSQQIPNSLATFPSPDGLWPQPPFCKIGAPEPSVMTQT